MTNFTKILWIQLKNSPERTKPFLVGIAGEYLYWNCGQSYAPWSPDEYTIVREFEYSGYDSIEAAEMELNREYVPQPQPVSARLGWISPRGEWYPCGYCCHHDLELLLAETNYDDSFVQLEKKGWISVKGKALIGVRNEHLIGEDAQNTLRKVVEEFEFAESQDPNINWDKILLANPEGYNEQSRFSSPTDIYHGGSYAEELRRTYDIYFGDYYEEVTPLIVPITKITYENEHPGD